jgi:hypothetical protein
MLLLFGRSVKARNELLVLQYSGGESAIAFMRICWEFHMKAMAYSSNHCISRFCNALDMLIGVLLMLEASKLPQLEIF